MSDSAGTDGDVLARLNLNPGKQSEQVILRLDELYTFKDHPFKVQDDEAMDELVESIKTEGVMYPIFVRARADGGYEILSGHRRRRASELAGLTEIPAKVLDVDDETAVIIMTDTNLVRLRLLPSEKAYAYKMKMDAIRRKAGRKKNEFPEETNSFPGVSENEFPRETNSLVGNSLDILAETSGESAAQIRRYIRLTFLTRELLNFTDDERIPFRGAVELSYLTQAEQDTLNTLLGYQAGIVGEKRQTLVTLAQAERIRKKSEDGGVSYDGMYDEIVHEPTPQPPKVKLDHQRLRSYFPEGYDNEQIQQTIFELLEQWSAAQRNGVSAAEVGEDNREMLARHNVQYI
jgi:ParB family chromosome partitioning protein